MKKSSCVLLIVFVFGWSLNTVAQSQFTGWLASFNTFKLGKKTSIHADIQWRSSDEWKQTQTLLVRSGLNYHINKKWTVTAGYALIHNYRTQAGLSAYLDEHRIWEQLLFSHRLAPAYTSHRLRLEQRFIPRVSVANGQLQKDGSIYANRFRYFIRNIVPLKKQAAFTRGMFATLQNEVFLNIGDNDNLNRKVFDQNRLYLAMGYRVNTKVDLEAGYMNQYISGRNNDFTNNHVAQLAVYLKL